MPGLAQSRHLRNTSTCANPKGYGGLLGYLPQNPSGSSLPGGSITHSLLFVGYHDGGWKFSSRDVQNAWIPLTQPQPTPTSGCLLIVLFLPQRKSFPSPGSALRQRLPNRFTQMFVNLRIFSHPTLFQRGVLNSSICPSLLFLLCKCCVGLELPEGWVSIQMSGGRRQKCHSLSPTDFISSNAIHYLQLILFLRHKGATGSQTDFVWVNMFKGAALI